MRECFCVLEWSWQPFFFTACTFPYRFCRVNVRILSFHIIWLSLLPSVECRVLKSITIIIMTVHGANGKHLLYDNENVVVDMWCWMVNGKLYENIPLSAIYHFSNHYDMALSVWWPCIAIHAFSHLYYGYGVQCPIDYTLLHYTISLISIISIDKQPCRCCLWL